MIDTRYAAGLCLHVATLRESKYHILKRFETTHKAVSGGLMMATDHSPALTASRTQSTEE